jgi:hypothetical protein
MLARDFKHVLRGGIEGAAMVSKISAGGEWAAGQYSGRVQDAKACACGGQRRVGGGG